MFGGVLIRAIKHIALGLRERVLVAHVSLRKQRKHCADGVARGGDKAAGCQDVGDAPAANPRCASSPLCRHWSRGDGGDWHAKPSTHPLPIKTQIRISRFVASARHPWNAAGFRAARASRPREPSQP
jgi:hypothetical protein